MKQIAIIGGGITGLSAAFYLEKARRAGARLEYTLFEKTARLGGALKTEVIEDCIVEAGADSFLTEKPWATELCRELGLADQLLGSNDEQRGTFIVHKQKLVPLPAGMALFVPGEARAIEKSQLFSARGKRRILREASFSPAENSLEDEAVAAFVERHFGSEMLERVADPLLAGIYGGDTRKLSARAVMPRFLEWEQRFGSLTVALRTRKPSAKAPALFTSLQKGMQQLVNGIAAELPSDAVRTRSEAVALKLDRGRWWVATRHATRQFDSLLLTTPAYASARLLRPVASKLASLLRRIPYSSSATVALGYRSKSEDGRSLRNLQGFGLLVPHSEKQRMLACTFVHNKFLQRVPPGKALLRVFFGGARDAAALALSDGELARLARQELKVLLQLQAEPAFVRVHRWERAMPQYLVGHGGLVELIDAEASRLPGLKLAGSAFRGVGVPDCVREGRNAALQIADACEGARGAT